MRGTMPARGRSAAASSAATITSRATMASRARRADGACARTRVHRGVSTRAGHIARGVRGARCVWVQAWFEPLASAPLLVDLREELDPDTPSPPGRAPVLRARRPAARARPAHRRGASPATAPPGMAAGRGRGALRGAQGERHTRTDGVHAALDGIQTLTAASVAPMPTELKAACRKAFPAVRRGSAIDRVRESSEPSIAGCSPHLWRALRSRVRPRHRT